MTLISFQIEDGIEFKPSQLLPEGKYPAEIIEIKQEVNKFNGEQMVLMWKLENGIIQKDNFYLWHLEENKRKGAQIKLRKLCHALGVKLTTDSGSVSLETDNLKGKQAIIVIKHISGTNNVIYPVINDYLNYPEITDSLPPYPFA